MDSCCLEVCVAYDRDFNHQAEMFNDDEYFEALEDLINDEPAFVEAVLTYRRSGRGKLAKEILVARIDELIEQTEYSAEARVEMIREEKRSGECA